MGVGVAVGVGEGVGVVVAAAPLVTSAEAPDVTSTELGEATRVTAPEGAVLLFFANEFCGISTATAPKSSAIATRNTIRSFLFLIIYKPPVSGIIRHFCIYIGKRLSKVYTFTLNLGGVNSIIKQNTKGRTDHGL